MPLPEVTGFNDERVRLLAAICREMQRLVGLNPFFLPTRKLGRLLGASWSSVARWLVALETLGVIHLAPGEVRRRGGSRSPHYHCDISLPSAKRSGQSNTAADLQAEAHQSQGRSQLSNQPTITAAAAVSV